MIVQRKATCDFCGAQESHQIKRGQVNKLPNGWSRISIMKFIVVEDTDSFIDKAVPKNCCPLCIKNPLDLCEDI